MPLKVDDLAVGQWVAIESEYSEDHGTNGGPFWFVPRQRSSRVDGMPLRIVAISLPFICVTDGRHRFVLDTRDVGLCRLCPKFVKSLTSTERSYDGNLVVIHDHREQRTSPDEKPERACPICSDRLIERYAAGVWCLACRQCGFTGGRGAEQ